MKRIAFIPVKLRSLRFPKKNFKILADKPLWEHSLKTALDLPVDQVCISTDAPEIKEGKFKDPRVLILDRPQHLAQDPSTVIDVLIHHIQQDLNLKEEDELITLMPTNPVRNSYKISQAWLQWSRENRYDHLISVSTWDISPLYALCESEGNTSIYFNDSPLNKNKTRIQDSPQLLKPNGNFYISKVKNIIKYRSFYKGKIKSIKISHPFHCDIDRAEDLEFIKFLWENGEIKLS